MRRDQWEGKQVGFGGIARRIERYYRRYRQRGEANSRMEAWLDKVMVEHTCPDCHGARVRATRLLFTVNGRTLHDVGQLNFDELHTFLGTVKPAGRGADAGRQVLGEIRRRLELLLGIGLDYLNFNRRSGTLSGGESQRIRLSTQIGSGLMGMLYVLDEPSIGLHPKDNVKMIATLERLRDIGNTVIVVEHDEDTIRAADHIVEMGPGPGVHGGRVVVQGTLDDVLKCKASPTGQFFSGKRAIATPAVRRRGNGKALVVRGARENNLKNIDVDDSRSACWSRSPARPGRARARWSTRFSTRRCGRRLEDTRTLPGDARRGRGARARPQGGEHRPVADRPQQPVEPGDLRRLLRHDPRPVHRMRRCRSSATTSPDASASTSRGAAARNARAKASSRRSSTSCRTSRSPAARARARGSTARRSRSRSAARRSTTCSTCRSRRGRRSSPSEPALARKIEVLNDLGLGYLTLGQSATTLSGGEAQRVKIATELSKLQRAKHTVYILDEPTTGLHLADVERLLDSLNRLVDAGHTVILIEHHMDVIKTADHVIDLGPEGGHGGGEVVVTGTPEHIAACKASHTGRFLKPHLTSR